MNVLGFLVLGDLEVLERSAGVVFRISIYTLVTFWFVVDIIDT